MTDIQIKDEILDIGTCLKLAHDESCGGIATFIGSVRNQTKEKKVLRLEFEAYKGMAVKEMMKIAEEVQSKFSVKNVVIHHRTGTLLPGDIAVIILVSDGHRDSVFDACKYAIDTLKKTVTIWKKEIFEDGEEWVSAHP
jgi:molybdopterin synthase catalytic subunit